MFDERSYGGLLDAVATAHESVAKGRALEALLVYLLQATPGVIDMERNSVNAFATEELDIAIIHNGIESLSFLPPVLLVECKNWSSPVDSAAISYFANVVKNRGCDVGILIAAAGITGRPTPISAGHFEAAIALARDGIKVLVVTLEDLSAVTCIDDFVGLLRRQLLRMIASGTYLP